MKKVIPFVLFFATTVFVLKAAIYFTSDSPEPTWEDISLKAVVISAALGLAITFMYKMFLTRVKILVLFIVVVLAIIAFNLLLRS